jgi:hypothetical protein
MKIPQLEDFHERLQKNPKLYRSLYPRRVACPADYADPKYYSASIYSTTMNGFVGVKTSTDSAITTVAHQLLKYQMPIFFIDPQFMAAAATTELPRDMTFGELKLPMPAMLLVFPVSFMSEYIRWRIPYMAISTTEDKEIFEKDGVRTVPKSVLFHIPLIPDDGQPISYAGWYPYHTTFGEVMKDGDSHDHYEDTTETELAAYKALLPHLPDDIFSHTAPVPEVEEEPKLINDLCLLGAKVLAIISTVPALVTMGAQTRKEWVSKTNPEDRRDALWSASFIGKGYKIHQAKESLGGTHAAPKMHWRRGHLHTVLHGEKKALRRRQWYEPVLVNAPS